ncbi:MucBP domain-containing protein [Vagococcus fluvialis]|uniref:MucBP domain-containing protein n=1 Tax=Vagococcus fluvialis TaxID=2738 RepID=UPI001D0A2450|nr:MucBP domain-containing protein [Vagococcus fluvialis]UDM84084.1 MucBP domain-containing protein [Vagococcus fluvialis]
MKKNKIIKGVVLSTMLFSTVALPVYSTVVSANTINVASNIRSTESNVSTLTLNFKDKNGNKLGDFEKTNIMNGKSYELKDTEYKNWKITKGNTKGVIKKGVNSVDLVVEPNKLQDVVFNFKDEDGNKLGNSTNKFSHGTVYDFSTEKIEGYELIKPTEKLVNGVDDNVDLVFRKTKNVPFVNPKIVSKEKGFKFSYMDLEDGSNVYESKQIVEIIPEKYNYKYKNVFNDINNDGFRPIQNSQMIEKDMLSNLDSYYLSNVKTYRDYDEQFDSKSGILDGTPVFEFTELLKNHKLSTDIPNAQISNIATSFLKSESNISDSDSIEDSNYFVTLIQAPSNNLANGVKHFWDFEINDVNGAITYDTKLDMNIPEHILKDYPRFYSDFDSKVLGKRWTVWEGGSNSNLNQAVSGFSEIYKKGNEYRIRVINHNYDNALTSTHTENFDNGTFAIKFELDSEITVNYVSQSGRILETSKEIIDKNTKYNIENKEFEDFKLKNENDKDKKVFVNKDMTVDIVYNPLKEEPVEPKPVEEKGTLVTKFVDKDGNDIAESIKEELLVGQEFKAVAKDIEGYTLKGEKEILGEMVKDGKTVIFEYSKDKEEPVKPVEPTKPTKPVEPKEPTENLKEIDKALKTNIQEVNKSRGIILGTISMILATCLGTFTTTFKKEKKEVKKDK